MCVTNAIPESPSCETPTASGNLEPQVAKGYTNFPAESMLENVPQLDTLVVYVSFARCEMMVGDCDDGLMMSLESLQKVKLLL